MRKKKFARESYTSTTTVVLPNDTNTLNNLMGGQLMHWMDINAAIAASKHCNRTVVTASVDNISFAHPIKLGNAVTLEAKVTRAFNSSMEVHLVVHAEDLGGQTRIKTNEAFLTFVAVDQHGKPIDVPELVPESDEEVKLFDGALRRRQVRLVLAGRMKPSDAIELRAFLDLEQKK